MSRQARVRTICSIRKWLLCREWYQHLQRQAYSRSSFSDLPRSFNARFHTDVPNLSSTILSSFVGTLGSAAAVSTKDRSSAIEIVFSVASSRDFASLVAAAVFHENPCRFRTT